jgi:hypothetical protein
VTKSTDEINDGAIDKIDKSMKCDRRSAMCGSRSIARTRDRSLGLDSDRNVVGAGTPDSSPLKKSRIEHLIYRSPRAVISPSPSPTPWLLILSTVPTSLNTLDENFGLLVHVCAFEINASILFWSTGCDFKGKHCSAKCDLVFCRRAQSALPSN